MSLTNAQYDSILRTYEEKQNRSRRLLNDRREEVYTKIPSYEALEHETASISVEQGKRLLSGEEDAVCVLHEKLADLADRKYTLLRDAGFPADYLEPVYECPDCKDTGYQNGKKCHCFQQKIITLLYEQSNIRELLRTENFDTLSFEYYTGEDLTRFQGAVRACRNFIEAFGSEYHNLFFYGTVGTGKSFLSSCIAKELIERGRLVIYFSAAGLFELLSQMTFEHKSKEELYSFYEDIYNCDLVIIDDLGTELTNSFVSSQLFSLLNERHLRRKSTLISTNLSLEELRDRYSDRIFSRITSNYEVCKITGPDIRMYKKRMLNRK
ncbi:MAG: ATP-binding protein [Lachnospiraceae bacterium]|nr:ATP-binding protein [Lachnospiraceae bacterium]